MQSKGRNAFCFWILPFLIAGLTKPEISPMCTPLWCQTIPRQQPARWYQESCWWCRFSIPSAFYPACCFAFLPAPFLWVAVYQMKGHYLVYDTIWCLESTDNRKQTCAAWNWKIFIFGRVNDTCCVGFCECGSCAAQTQMLLLQHPAGGWHKGETLCAPEGSGDQGVPAATRVEEIRWSR